jgi:hypothetical protein
MGRVRYTLSAAAAPTEEDVVDEVLVSEEWIGRKVMVKVRASTGAPTRSSGGWRRRAKKAQRSRG